MDRGGEGDGNVDGEARPCSPRLCPDSCFGLASVVPPHGQVPEVVPRGADNIQVAVAVEVTQPRAEMALLALFNQGGGRGAVVCIDEPPLTRHRDLERAPHDAGPPTP